MKFVKGKKYRYTGMRGVRPDGWNVCGQMDALLDGEPHVCTGVEHHSAEDYVTFEGFPREYYGDGFFGEGEMVEASEEDNV